MKNQLLVLFFAILVIGFSCTTVPLTGRKQLKLLPESQLVQMSLAQYSEFLDGSNVVKSTDSQAKMVKRVGQKLAKEVETVLRIQGQSDRIKGFKWEFNLVEDDLVNAWAMPGGKVVVYTGLLKVTQDETGLAVVMGHEIAHAVARHGNERMSQGMLTQTGFAALDIALSKKPQQTRDLFMTAAGLGAQIGVMLPFSRKHESEADEMGLIFMASAGYDPHAASKFWKRMAKSGGAGVPEFLSTHPNHQTRINNIENKYMRKAMQYYNRSKLKH